MLKELKYFLFLLVIILFFSLTLKYYFSDNNIKNSYRSHKQIDNDITIYSQEVTMLKNDTHNVVEYIEKTIDKNKKNYKFWDLITKKDE